MVSLAMSRQVIVPLLLGADPASRGLPALDAAGFSAAIPGLLHYDLPEGELEHAGVLQRLLDDHRLAGIVDGAMASLIPARYAWEAVEAGRLGSRNCAIVALDAVPSPRGVNAPLAPLLRVISATADRDRPFWDVKASFPRTPAFLDLFPTTARLRRAADDGDAAFAPTAELLRKLLAPIAPWKEITADLRGASRG